LFKVFDIDDVSSDQKDFIGQIETTIGKIVGATRQTLMQDLMLPNENKPRGKIVVRLDNVSGNNDEIRFQFRANLTPIGGLCCPANNPFFLIWRARDQNNKDEFIKVHKSSPILNNPNPVFGA